MTNDWLKDILGPESKTFLDIDSVKLERALTVPRFRRENPHSHILVAKNGDLKRGNLLGMSTQTIQFESKLRKQTFPVDRLACVVNVSQPEEEPNGPSVTTTDPKGQVRADLADGSILIFAALESRDGKLIGRSTLYGDMAIPTESVQNLSMGGFEKEPLTSLFEEWVVRPAQEPIFSQPPPPISQLQNAEEPTAPSSDTTVPGPNQPSDVVSSDVMDPPVERKMVRNPSLDPNEPNLGKVHIDPKNRSLRLPISINQRSGPVE